MKLILLGTPIGRLNDISRTFLETVNDLGCLAVEDTREAGQLLRLLQERYPDYSLWPKKLIGVYREKEREMAEEIISLLNSEQNIGYMSDAGMPGVADPGSYLVSAVKRVGHDIDCVPGPSALSTALSLSGFEAGLTLFVGFLPKKFNLVKKLIECQKNNGYSSTINLVFFESPFRIAKTVNNLFSLLPDGKLFLGRELTKKHQELLWIESKDLPTVKLLPKGEYTGVFHLKVI